MQTQRLGSRQLFTMIRGNLEKRIIKFYSETNDGSAVIEYAVAVLVRQALTLDFAGFSFMCQDLIRELFLNTAPSHTLRRFSVFFESYFDKQEWQTVIDRLYRNEKEYLTTTQEARSYSSYLTEKDPTRTDELGDHQFILKSIFKGENGRKHTWTLKNAHPTKNQEEIAGALKILTLLSIFETKGIRKFTEFVECYRDATVRDLHHAEVCKLAEKSDEAALKKEQKDAEQADVVPKKAITSDQAHKQEARPSVDNKRRNNETNNLQAQKKLPDLKRTDPPESSEQSSDVKAVEMTGPDSQRQKRSVHSPRRSAEQLGLLADRQRKTELSYFGKSEEQKTIEKNDRNFKRRVAKLLGKRGKK